jgi:hypothetical protein
LCLFVRDKISGRASRGDPPFSWFDRIGSDRDAAFYLWHGLTPRTRETYTVSVDSYVKWAALQRVPFPYFPVRVQNLGAFVAYLGLGVDSATIKRYLSGQRSHHIDVGFSIVTFPDPALERIGRGIQRYRGNKRVKQAWPITLPILEAIVRYALESAPDADTYRFVAPCTLAFGRFLRLGELT